MVQAGKREREGGGGKSRVSTAQQTGQLHMDDGGGREGAREEITFKTICRNGHLFSIERPANE
jgi:hypothetical protein